MSTAEFHPSPHLQAARYDSFDAMIFREVGGAANSPVVEASRQIARAFCGPLGLAMDASRRVGDANHTNTIGHDDADRFVFDGFAALFRSKPEQSGMGTPLTRDVLARVMADQRFPAVRGDTIGDEVAAAFGASALLRVVAENLPKDVKQRAEEERKAREQAEDAAGYAEAMENDPGADPQEQSDARAAAAKAKQKSADAAAALAASVSANAPEIGAAVARGVGAAQSSADAVRSSGNAFGVGSFDPGAGMDVASRMQLAKMVEKAGPAFRELLRIIGRVVQDRAEKSARKLASEHGDVAEVASGSDIDRLVEDELAAIADKRDVLALARLADDAMMQVEVEARETEVKGDLIILLDESGSMSSVVHPDRPEVTREAEAKGITIALAHSMVRERRSVKVLFFQSEVTHTIEITPADVTRRVDGCPAASRKLAEIASRSLGGGTLFDPPLRTAMAELDKGRAKGADVMMITDGYSAVSDEVSKLVADARRKHGVTFYAMAIGKDARQSVPVFAKFADKVFSGDSLMEGAKQLVEVL